ncbi:MAG: hypothetical protein K6G47_02215 [Clostridia bacterium]|nr:hypothetical protein [Clostridia bacterium]
MKKLLVLPLIFLTIMMVGCKNDKKDSKETSSERIYISETTEKEKKKMATPTPTPIPDDLEKSVYYKNGGSEIGSVSEYDDGKLTSFFEYEHGDSDEEYQTIYTYKDDLLVKEEHVYNGNMDKVSFDNRMRGYTLYYYNEQNLLNKELIYDENDELIEEYYYLYDEFGYKMTTRIENGEKYVTMTAPNGYDTYFEQYDENGDLIERRDYEYEFDDLGNKISYTLIVNGETERQYLFEYDEFGNEIKAFTYWYGEIDTVVTTEYAPDYSWKMTTLTKYDYEGNECSSRLFYRAYNENGQEIEFWYKDSGDEEPAEDIFNTYDENGNKISMVNGDYTTIYKYDDQGRLIEEDAFFRDELSYFYSYSYEDS